MSSQMTPPTYLFIHYIFVCLLAWFFEMRSHCIALGLESVLSTATPPTPKDGRAPRVCQGEPPASHCSLKYSSGRTECVTGSEGGQVLSLPTLTKTKGPEVPFLETSNLIFLLSYVPGVVVLARI